MAGTRVQTMFETVVAALGKVKAIKQEDAGDGYFDEDVIVPDYRLVLDDRSQVLIEVENFEQKRGAERFELDLDRLQKLQAYADLMGVELLSAVYWYGWNIWTLVPARVFVVDADKATLEMGDAFGASQMSRLGDMMIADDYDATRTALPLWRFRLQPR
jgi:hypothetical protein